MKSGRFSFRIVLLLSTLVIVLYQNCSKFQTTDSSSYSIETNTYVIEGVYREYHVDHLNFKDSSIISSVEDVNKNSFQFNKSDLSPNMLMGISIGDRVQIELPNSEKTQKMVASKIKNSQSSVMPLGIRKVPNAQNIFIKNDLVKSGEVDFTVAFVYMDYLDHQASETYLPLPDAVRTIITDNTWNSIRLHSTAADMYRLKINKNFPGCNEWLSMGGAAIQYVNGVLKKDYNRVVTIIPPNNVGDCYWSGITSAGYSYIYPGPSPIVSRTSSEYVAAHELGHSLGLGHSSKPNQGNYGDSVDVMGRGNSLNVAKLVDLNVLQTNRGLVQVGPNSEMYTVHGKSTNVLRTQKTIAFQVRDFLVSLSERYGLTIHTRTGAGAMGNDPSSFELAKLLPGEVWESDDKQVKLQFLKWDLVNNLGSFKVNSEDDDSGGFIGGCQVYRLFDSTLYLADRYSDATSGFLEFSPGVVGRIGDCAEEEFSVEIVPEGNEIKTVSIFNFKIDLRSDVLPKVYLPYTRLAADQSYRVKTIIKYKGQVFLEKFHNINSINCDSTLQLCRYKDSCQLPATSSIVFNTEQVQVGDIREGYIAVTNPNGIACAINNYEINLSYVEQNKPNTYLNSQDIEIGKSLSSLNANTDFFLRKRLFVSPGTSVRVPLKIRFTRNNIDAILRINLLSTAPARSGNNLDMAWNNQYSGSVNAYVYSDTSLAHPHNPQDITPLNITGLISSMPPSCRVETLENGQYKDLNRLSLKEGEALNLRVTSQYADSTEYSCDGGSWNAFKLANSNQLSVAGLTDSLSCQLRAIRKEGNKTLISACAPVSRLEIVIDKPDKATCTVAADSKLTSFKLTASLRIGDSSKGKPGFKYIAGKTKSGQWYTFNGKNWVTELVPISIQDSALSDIPSTILFNGDDLTAFEGTQIYLGYGFGNSTNQALDELIKSVRLFACSTIK